MIATPRAVLHRSRILNWESHVQNSSLAVLPLLVSSYDPCLWKTVRQGFLPEHELLTRVCAVQHTTHNIPAMLRFNIVMCPARCIPSEFAKEQFDYWERVPASCKSIKMFIFICRFCFMCSFTLIVDFSNTFHLSSSIRQEIVNRRSSAQRRRTNL